MQRRRFPATAGAAPNCLNDARGQTASLEIVHAAGCRASARRFASEHQVDARGLVPVGAGAAGMRQEVHFAGYDAAKAPAHNPAWLARASLSATL
jgi:hypothetical protein